MDFGNLFSEQKVVKINELAKMKRKKSNFFYQGVAHELFLPYICNR